MTCAETNDLQTVLIILFLVGYGVISYLLWRQEKETSAKIDTLAKIVDMVKNGN